MKIGSLMQWTVLSLNQVRALQLTSWLVSCMVGHFFLYSISYDKGWFLLWTVELLRETSLGRMVQLNVVNSMVWLLCSSRVGMWVVDKGRCECQNEILLQFCRFRFLGEVDYTKKMWNCVLNGLSLITIAQKRDGTVLECVRLENESLYPDGWYFPSWRSIEVVLPEMNSPNRVL